MKTLTIYKILLFLSIAAYMLLFFVTGPPYKNYLPVVWLLASAVLIITAILKTRNLYIYISEKYPEHKASFNSMPKISVSKTLTSIDVYVKDKITNINNLYYVGITSLLGFIVFHVGITLLAPWM